MKTQDIRNMALAFQAVTEKAKAEMNEATVSSSEVIHDLPHKDQDAHAAQMKKTHGVKTTFRYDKLKYHGSKPQVKKALVHLYGKEHRHVASAKSAVEEEHPHLYEEAVIEKKSVTEATVSSGQVLHDLEYKDEPAHAVQMKKKHGVKTTFHGQGELKYHGSKPQVKKALVDLYGKHHRHVASAKSAVEEEHPHLYEEAVYVEEATVSSGEVIHDVPHKDWDAHAAQMKKKHGVKTTYRYDKLKYHGSKPQVKKALVDLYGKDHRHPASAKSAVEEEHPHLYEEAVYTEKKLAGDQHELDHDKDGDIDAADFKGLRNKGKKDKKSKVEVKPTQKMDTDKSQEETTKESTELESLETQIKETYVGVQTGMRRAMMQMWEKASHKANQPGEEIDSKDSVTAKKMRADHKPEVNDTEEKGHNDAAAAGRVGPKAAARNGDNMKGDKAIINPVKGTT